MYSIVQINLLTGEVRLAGKEMGNIPLDNLGVKTFRAEYPGVTALTMKGEGGTLDKVECDNPRFTLVFPRGEVKRSDLLLYVNLWEEVKSFLR